MAVELDDAFRTVFEKTKASVQCITLGFYVDDIEPFDSTKGYGIATFKPFPLIEEQFEYSINVYYFNELNLNSRKIGIIGFTDRDFRANLEYDKPIKTNNEEVHSLNFAVLLN